MPLEPAPVLLLRKKRTGWIASRQRMRLPPQNQGVARCGKRDFVPHPIIGHCRHRHDHRVPDRRRPPALLGPAGQLLPVALQRAADPVPLWRLPRAAPAVPASTLCNRFRGTRHHRNGLRRNGVGPPRPHRRDALRRRAATGRRAADGRRRAGVAGPRRRCVRPRAPGGMTDPRWGTGYALLARHGLRFDLQTPWWHLHEAAALARRFSETTIILNHTGLPADRSPAGIAGWKRGMAALADCPNAAAKISGLGVPGQAWTVAANRAIVLTTIELFGVDRCMFASNFPVDGLCATFDTIFSGFREMVRDFTAGEQRRLFHDNALRIYGME